MSWKATAWAKETTGHHSRGEKFTLVILAEYADPETNEAWPSQATLARQLMMSPRHLVRCLNQLQANGFITRLQKGNQFQRTVYRINVLSHATIQESDTRGSDAMAHALSEGDTEDTKPIAENVTPEVSQIQELVETAEQVTSTTSESDIHVHTSLQEPPVITEKETSKERTGPPMDGKDLTWRFFSAEETGELLQKYPGVDLAFEAQRCMTWWAERSGPPTKNPKWKSRFYNWMGNVRVPPKGGSRGRTGGFDNSVEKFADVEARIAATDTGRSVLPEV